MQYLFDNSIILISFVLFTFFSYSLYSELWKVNRNAISGDELLQRYIKIEQIKIKRGEKNVIIQK